MVTDAAAMAVVRAVRPAFRGAHDGVAFAAHAAFLAAGYSLCAVGPAALTDPPPSGNEEVGIYGWNNMENSYAFLYNKEEKGKKKRILVKCLVVDDLLAINVLDLEAQEKAPHYVRINVRDFFSEVNPKNYGDMYKNFAGLIENINSNVLSKFDGIADAVVAKKTSAESSSSVKRESMENMWQGMREFNHTSCMDLAEGFGRTEQQLNTGPVVRAHNFSNPAPLAPTAPEQRKKGVAKRLKNFTRKEDEYICSTYLNVSKDPIVGVNQPTGPYWPRMTEYFHEHKTTPYTRSQSSLQHRWSSIQKDTSRFCELYAEVERKHQNGKSEDDKIKDALQMYEGIVGNPFKFLHCWFMLRNEMKWNTWLSSMSTSDPAEALHSEQQTKDGTIPGTIERQVGRGRAKKQCSSNTSSSSSGCLEVLQKISMHHTAYEEHLDATTNEEVRDVASCSDTSERTEQQLNTGPVEGPQNFSHPAPTAPEQRMKGVSKRLKNFSTKEDEYICLTYLNVSKDPIVGVTQPLGPYWARMTEYFHEHKTTPYTRSQSSLQHRWSSIQKDTSRFCEFYAEVERKHQTGKSENDKINEALQMFEGIVGNQFKFLHCWFMLRNEMKWNTSLSSLSTCTPLGALHSEQQTNTPVETLHTERQTNTPAEALHSEQQTKDGTIPGNIERPIGRERAKKQRSNGTSSSSSACVEVLQKTSMHHPAYEERLEAATKEDVRDVASCSDTSERKLALQEQELQIQKAQLLIRQELLQLQKEDREERVMNMDLEKMAPWVREYYINKQKKIAAMSLRKQDPIGRPSGQ